jgi:hypothetical protein
MMFSFLIPTGGPVVIEVSNRSRAGSSILCFLGAGTCGTCKFYLREHFELECNSLCKACHSLPQAICHLSTLYLVYPFCTIQSSKETLSSAAAYHLTGQGKHSLYVNLERKVKVIFLCFMGQFFPVCYLWVVVLLEDVKHSFT